MLTHDGPEKECTMRLRPGMAVLAILCSMSATPAFAAVCLDKSMSIDEIVEAINATPSCERAMKLATDCQLGTGGDTQLGAAVEKKCESDFPSRLKPPQMAAYKRELGVCDRKYRNQSGTMYVSFTAFCRAEVAQRYSQRALKKKP
jgi:hypothetical protein